MDSAREKPTLDEALECSRLVTLAYYEHHSISILRKSEPDKWDRFLKALTEPSGITIADDLTSSGGARPAVQRDRRRLTPSTRMLVDAVFGGDIPQGVLDDRFRIQLRKRCHINDTPEFLDYSAEYVALLSDQVGQSFERSYLQKMVAGSPRWAEGIVELLEWYGVVEPEPPDDSGQPPKLAIVKRTDHSRFITMTFARSTGIEGLDHLLFGGYYAPRNELGYSCLTMAISGPPGIGKSNLAMGFAASAAARGAAAIYIDDERPTDNLQRQVQSFYKSLSRRFQVERMKRNEFLEGNMQFQGGRLYLSGLEGPTLSLTDLTNKVRNVVKTGEHPAEMLVVIDSVSARRQAREDWMWRDELIYATALLTERGFSVLLVLERNTNDFATEDYAVDLSIHLSNYFEPTIAYAQRILEIVKSRHQFSNRGGHFFTIRAGRGAVVYPSSAASITMRRRSEVLRPLQDPKFVTLGNIKGFAKYAGRSAPPLLDDGDIIRWWREGSLTLLIGPRSSLKQAFAAAFCEFRGESNESVLSVHFGSDLPWSGFRGTRDNKLVRSRVGLLYRSRSPESADVYDYLFRTSYFAPGPVMDEIGHFLDEQVRSHQRVKRAVISDLSVLAPHFPFLRQDPLFIPTLCDLLSSHEVTTCIVYTPQESEEPDPVYEQLSSFVNNVIAFTGPENGPHELTVTSSETNRHFPGHLNIRRPEGAGVEVLLPAELTAVNGDPIKVHIYLAGGSDIQNQHNQDLKTSFEPNFVVGMQSPAVLYSQRPVMMASAFERNTLNISMVDAYRVPWLSGDNPLKSRLLEPIWESTKELQTSRRKLSYRGSDVIKSGDEVLYTVPYFLNPSLLVLQSEFAEFMRGRLGLSAAAEEEAPALEFKSWAELMQFSREFRPKAALAPFSFSRQTGETLNCIFFEILYTLPGGPQAVERLCEGFGVLFRLAEEDERTLCAAFGILLELWQAAGESEGGAVFWREWYTTFRDLAKGLSERGVKVELARLPGGIWTNGDWHLAILAGSSSPWLGLRIIREQFVSHDNAMTLMNVGVGLPPFHSFYNKGGRLPVSRVAPNWFSSYVGGHNVIYRARLPKYSQYGRVLSFHLDSMLKGANEDMIGNERARDKYFTDRLHDMFRIISRNPDTLPIGAAPEAADLGS